MRMGSVALVVCFVLCHNWAPAFGFQLSQQRQQRQSLLLRTRTTSSSKDNNNDSTTKATIERSTASVVSMSVSSRADTNYGEQNSSSRTWAQRPSSRRGGSGSTSSTSLLPPPRTAGTLTQAARMQQQQQPTNHRQQQQRQQQTLPTERKRKTKPMPFTGYDFQAIEELYDRRPLQVGWRLNSLGIPLLGWYLSLLLDRSTGASDNENIQRLRGEQLRMHLVRSKSVALIKSGQALSLRPDLIKNKIWAEELGKLVDAVGAFSDKAAMRIMQKEFVDLYPRLEVTKSSWKDKMVKTKKKRRLTSVERLVEKDPVLSMFDFYNDNKAVASASIGQVYKAKIRRGPQLDAAIGPEEAAKWGGKTVAIKVQRPDVEASASLDMYLLRKTCMWLSTFRGGDLPAIADQFGMQLFGELDYVREADNCERFGELYESWDSVEVPAACRSLTRKRVLVMEWVEGEKGPWQGDDGLEMVSIGLRCSVDQLMCTGLFHADPHRGNMLKTPKGKLALIDFGSMADIDEDFRYGLFGLVMGLQNKDLKLVTENLLKLGFLEDTTQLDLLIPRLRSAMKSATGGTGKASNVNFAQLQAELDQISRENVLRFKTPPFFTVILRSLTILEGVALSVDPKFRLVRGAYPYVLNSLLSPRENAGMPEALNKLLIQQLTVNGDAQEIEWERLRGFLALAQKAAKTYDPSEKESDDRVKLSRNTIEMFFDFLTSRAGLFLKKPLVHELAEAIDGFASMGEANLLKTSGGLLPALPGMNGPINTRRMDEIRLMLDTFEDALVVSDSKSELADAGSDHSGDGVGGGLATLAANRERAMAMIDLLRELVTHLGDERLRLNSGVLLAELQSVAQLVAVEVLEIRGTRAMRSVLRVGQQ